MCLYLTSVQRFKSCRLLTVLAETIEAKKRDLLISEHDNRFLLTAYKERYVVEIKPRSGFFLEAENDKLHMNRSILQCCLNTFVKENLKQDNSWYQIYCDILSITAIKYFTNAWDCRISYIRDSCGVMHTHIYLYAN